MNREFARRIAALSPKQREMLHLRLQQEQADRSKIRPLPRAGAAWRFPLSFAQQRLWFLDHLEPESAVYNLPVVVRLSGKLNLEALGRAINEVVRRHEVLRTSFALVEGKPLQEVSPSLTLDLPVIEIEPAPEAAREARVQAIIKELAQRPFDLSRAPLIRACVLKLRDTEHIVLLTMHHIVSDAWSMGIMMREITALYEAFIAGRPSPLPELPIQYADYATWQRSFLDDSLIEEQLSYWREQLAGAPAVLELPTDYPRPPAQTFRGASQEVALSPELSSRLRSLGKREGCTLFMTLLAGFQALLSKYTRQDDIVVGTSIAGRNRREVEDLIGFFVNTLVLRLNLEGDPDFRTLLQRAREVVLGANSHQDLPFERLVDELHLERSMSHTPLFQVMFVLLPSLDPAQGEGALPELRMGAGAPHTETAKFDMTLSMVDAGQRLAGSLEYNSDLFRPDTIKRMLGHFESLLESLASDPSRRLSSVCLLTEAERDQILVDWNSTRRDYPDQSSLHALFERQVARTPNATALTFEGESLSYRELNRRANRFAHRLRLAGLRPAYIVGVTVPRSTELVVALLAVLKSGAAYLPIDSQLPPARLEYILAEAGVEVVVTAGEDAAWLKQKVATVIDVCDEGEAIGSREEEDLGVEVSGDDLAYVIYTSGSTGKPKGVMIPHRAVVNFLTSMREEPGLSSRDILLAITPLSFDIAGLELFLPLITGACVCVATRHQATDPTELTRAISSSGATVMQATPATWRMLLDGGWQGDKNLKALCGGEALQQQLGWSLAEKTSQVWNLYGPTETTIWSAISEVRVNGEIRIGRPIANTTMYVVDSRMNLAAVGVSGELCIGGDGLARGYLNRPDLTAERFLPDPFSSLPGARLYRTGDLARFLPDGLLDFIGRLDLQVKLRGFRIELGDIENALALLPSVRDCAVCLRHDTPGHTQLAAFLTPVAGLALDTSLVRSHLKSCLPDYMLPQLITIIEQMPLNPNGKIDRKALGRLKVAGPERDGGSRPPRTDGERKLAEIMSQVLRLERVGVDENFFELGGDSILSLQVVERARGEGLRLRARDLFQHQTVAELAVAVDEAAAERAAEEVAHKQEQAAATSTGFALVDLSPDQIRLAVEGGGEVEQVYPLTPAQAGILFHTLMGAGSGVYVNQLSCILRGQIDAERLRHAWEQVIATHEALRVRFVWEGLDQPVQVVMKEVNIDWRNEDRSHLDQDDRNELARQEMDEQRREGFDLRRAGLMRIRLYGEGEGRHRFMWSYPHVLMDGWSAARVLKEVFGAYEGREPGAERVPGASYRDYMQWLVRQDKRKAERYWKARLAGVRAATRLGIEYAGGRERQDEAADRLYSEEEVRLSREASERLRTRSRKEAVTLSTVVVGAWALVLSRYSGERDVVFGVTSSGRPEQVEGAEQAVGLMITTLPAKVRVEEAAEVWEWLKGVQLEQAEMREHEAIGMVDISRWAEAGRAVADVESIVVFENYPVDRELKEAGKAGGELAVEGVRGVETTNYGLTLVAAADGELVLRIGYEEARYTREAIKGLVEQVAQVIEGMTDGERKRVSHLTLLGDEEVEKQITKGRGERREVRNSTIQEAFEEQARERADRTALVMGGEEVSYRELNRRANRLAHRLRLAGLRHAYIVGVTVPRSTELVVALLAVLKSGAAYLPIDSQLPPARLEYILAEAGVEVVVTAGEDAAWLKQKVATVIDVSEKGEAIGSREEEDLGVEVSGDDLAYVIYTSGSTGKPKGVAVPHRGVMRLVKNTDYVSFSSEEVFLQFAPVSFDASTFEIWGALLNGARLVLPPADLISLQDLGKIIQRHRVTTLWLTAGLFQQMVIHNLEGLRGVRQLLAGGDVLPVAQATEALEKLEGCTLINGYGPTETTTFACCHRMRSPRDIGQSVSIGSPIANTDVYILDHNFDPVPSGATGHLWIGGDGLARGYVDQPAMTAENFLPDPFSDHPGARMYRTGDLARYQEDGNIEFLGRADHQIKLRGFRVEPGEVESILERHPAVQACVVLARQETQGDRRLVAYIVARPDHQPGAAELTTYLQERLPDYMIPSAFVLMDEFPLTSNGKVDRKALPAPEPARGRQGVALGAPRTPVEEMLAEVWAAVLGVDAVATDEDFFELGGHSLSAMRVIGRVKEVFGVELPMDRLFLNPTVAGLARCLEEARRDGPARRIPPIMHSQGEGAAPLTFIQQRIWFLEKLMPGTAVYNIPASVRMSGRLDLAALEASFNETLRRHDVLRTRFVLTDEEPAQIVQPSVDFILPVIDLGELPEAERNARAEQVAREEAETPFDLTRAPLLRARLLRYADDEHVLFLTMHHIISDAWSMSVLIEEMTQLYAAFSEGKDSPLSKLPIQYADFARWQRSWVQGEALQDQVAYWRKQLGGALPVLQLPTDRPRPALQTYKGGTVSRAFPETLSKSVRAMSRQEGATPFMLLLAAFHALLYRLTGQEDIIVGSSIASRPNAETERLIGCFLNTVGLRVNLSGDPTIRELLKRVREVTLGAYENQDLPFDQVIELVHPERKTNQSPLYQVFFAMLNNPQAQYQGVPGLTLTSIESDTRSTQFELSLVIWEAGAGLTASLTYNTDLFDAETARRLLTQYETLLASIQAHPEASLSALDIMTEAEKDRRSSEDRRREEAKRRKFMAIKPKAVSVSSEGLVKAGALETGETLPLVIRPQMGDVDLVEWARSNLDLIDAELTLRGGILFRDFGTGSLRDFESFINATHSHLLEYLERSTPRTEVGGRIYTSTEYPANQSIALHNEFSYARSWPMRISFFCERAATSGGETPVADCRRVFQLLDPALRDRFIGKRVMYVRNYGNGIDLTWQTAFQTEDRQEVERYCRQAPIGFEWRGRDGLKTWQVREAVARHPKTGEMVWFNQAHLFHITNLESDIRESLSATFDEDDLPRNAYYGDGSRIEASALDEIREAYREASTVFPWQEGDILLLDNMLVAHGRTPYAGPRRILVAMADPFNPTRP